LQIFLSNFSQDDCPLKFTNFNFEVNDFGSGKNLLKSLPLHQNSESVMRTEEYYIIF